MKLKEKAPELGHVYFWPLGQFSLISAGEQPADMDEAVKRLNVILESAATDVLTREKAFEKRKTEFDPDDEESVAREMAMMKDTLESRPSVDDAPLGFESMTVSAVNAAVLGHVKNEHKYTVLSFVNTIDAETGATDFTMDSGVAVWGAFESEESANAYVKKASSKIRSDVDVIVAKTGVWLYPSTLETKEVHDMLPRMYRNDKLNDIMQAHEEGQAAAAAAIEAGATVTEIDMVPTSAAAEFDPDEFDYGAHESK